MGPWTKRTGCHRRGPLPDAACTPGARYSRVGKRRVCTPGYAGSVRNVPESRKRAVYAAYSSPHYNGRTGEVDHLVSLELGGSNSISNLFPEPAEPRPGSHEKDRLENRLHSEICSGEISLGRAQRVIATDWVKAYRARFSGR
jgi:5-methylcytosine-specific restriction endonuclease McrA